MEDMLAVYNEVVELSKQTDSITDKRAAVEAFIQFNCDDSLLALPSRHAVVQTQHVVGGRSLLASRTDTRAMPYLAAQGAPTWPAVAASRATAINIFADKAFHVDAAATLAGHAARQSGFGASMVEGNAESQKLFQAYLKEFAGAPHWLYKVGTIRTLKHSAANHQQFMLHLGAAITADMNSINAGQNAIDSAVRSVNTLASLLTSSDQDGSISSTLYATIGMSREPANEGPLFYGIFYTTLDMKHQVNAKSKVVSADVVTYSLLYQLNSPLLVKYADSYARLIRMEVEDWFQNLEIF